MKLKEMKLPTGTVRGLDVNYSGWTGNELKLKKAPEGYGGWRLIGNGTTIHTPEDNSVNIGPDSGRVVIENVRILMGKSRALYAGAKYFSSHPGDSVCLIGFDIVGLGGKWGIDTNGMDLDLLDGSIDLNASEHNIYWHGASKYGMRIRNVNFLGAGAEAIKATYRPWEIPKWIPNTRIIVEDCMIRNFSQRGWGGGIVLQGTGSDIEIRRTAIWGDKSIMIDNGLSPIRTNKRYYDQNGVPNGPGAANGHIYIEDCAAEGKGKELVRVGKEVPAGGETWDHDAARSITIARGGYYSGLVDLRAMDPEKRFIRNINSEATNSYCQAYLGMDSEDFCVVRVTPQSG